MPRAYVFYKWGTLTGHTYQPGDRLECVAALDVPEGRPEPPEEYVFAAMNRGSGMEDECLDGDELRSMSVGDVVVLIAARGVPMREGEALAVAAVGWQRTLPGRVLVDSGWHDWPARLEES